MKRRGAEDKSASLFRERNFHASRIPLNKGSELKNIAPALIYFAPDTPSESKGDANISKQIGAWLSGDMKTHALAQATITHEKIRTMRRSLQATQLLESCYILKKITLFS